MTVEKVAVILDDHRFFADTFLLYLEKTSLFKAIHVFETEKETTSFFTKSFSEEIFLFVDYYIPNTNTFDLISKIRGIYPPVYITVVTSLSNPDILRKLLICKIDGIISKSDGTGEIMEGLGFIRERKLFLSPRIRKAIEENKESLLIEPPTSRELEILKLLSLGKSVMEISDELFISRHTVITHRRNLLAKSDCSSTTELVAYALKAGLI